MIDTMRILLLYLLTFVLLCSCKTTTKTITELKEVYVHDTTEVEILQVVEKKIAVHDTLYQYEYKTIVDSTIIYMDADGNVVNRDHYRNEVADKYKERISVLESERDSLYAEEQRRIKEIDERYTQKIHEIESKTSLKRVLFTWSLLGVICLLVIYGVKKML